MRAQPKAYLSNPFTSYKIVHIDCSILTGAPWVRVLKISSTSLSYSAFISGFTSRTYGGKLVWIALESNWEGENAVVGSAVLALGRHDDSPK